MRNERPACDPPKWHQLTGAVKGESAVVPHGDGESGCRQDCLGDGVPDTISWGDVRIAAVIDWAGEVPDAIKLLPGTSRTDWDSTGAGCPALACGIRSQTGGL
jgi:hypothetical protein